MAKAAGLNARSIRELSFREVMAEHAVKLLISIVVKEKVSRDNRRQKMLGISATATKTSGYQAGQTR
jgi:hypothetical protein